MKFVGTFETLEAFQEKLAAVFPGENVEVDYTTTWEEEKPHPQMASDQGVWVRCTERMVWNLQHMNHQYTHRLETIEDSPKIWILHTEGFPVHVLQLR